jgi:acyl transferase domain-containing protein/aryl carrier-like protein
MTSQNTEAAAGSPELPDAIAVTGLACRFPGSPDAEAFWANLVAGRDSITVRTPAQLAALGVPPARLADPGFVPAGGVLDAVDEFDAEYFGITPRDAALMDPQHRLFLQCAVAALEDAGQPTRGVPGDIGVYASAGFNSYLTHHLLPHAAELGDRADVQWLAAGDKDYLATQTAYRLGLTGPCLSVQTACSSALVAVHLAGEALLSGECDVALAGAVSAGVAQGLGYLHTEGGILSADGRCRPFDADATGTVFGSGVGVVVLKRLADAVADGDTVRAVLVGSAVNNDGDRKVGFTAPGLDGQVRVITAAQSIAGVGPEDISCVEAHGTGTALGDRIELTALGRVFADAPDRGRVLGAVKSNVGHLDTCAGMAGLIKTVLALQHRTLLPTAHFETPSPDLDPDRFRVLGAPEPWEGEDGTRTAGVSSFGIGGTNAHVILQDAPPEAHAAAGTDRGWQVLPLSARSPEAVERASARLGSTLARPGAPDLADAAHTLQTGRGVHAWRRAIVAPPGRTAPLDLSGPPPVRAADATAPSVALLYPGQGAGVPGMAAEPYRHEPAFRAALDRCLEALRPWTDADLRGLLLDPAHPDLFHRTEVAQPALFAVGHALTEWCLAIGVRPVALAGHSVGELAAACAGGVFTLPDAARLVARRGELMSRMPEGAMLAVPLAEAELRDLLAGDGAAAAAGLETAAVNAPDRCVVAGDTGAVQRLRAALAERGVDARPLPVRHAFHSRHADALLEEFAALVAELPARPPRLTIVSTLTGRALTAEEATSPRYWARQMREAVRFADALRQLSADVLLEAGPGRALSGFARRTLGSGPLSLPLLAMPGGGAATDPEAEPPARLTAVARLWERGTPVDWTALGERTGRRHVSLPTYPFEPARHWFEPSGTARASIAPIPASAGGATPGTARAAAAAPVTAPAAAPASGAVEDWLRVLSWVPSVPPAAVPVAAARTVLILADESGVAEETAARLIRDGARVHLVHRARSPLPGGIRAEGSSHLLDADDPDAFRALAAELEVGGVRPDAVVSCWALDDVLPDGSTADLVARRALRAVTVPRALARALGDRFPGRPPRMLLVSDAALPAGGPPRTPHAATAIGPARVLPLELPGSVVRVLDLDCAGRSTADMARAAEAVTVELAALAGGAGTDEPVVAVRGRSRLVPAVVRPALGAGVTLPAPEPPAGTWLITGGLGGIGIAVAERLAAPGRTLVLLTRRPVPDGSSWRAIRPKGAPPAQSCPPEQFRVLAELSDRGAEVCLVQCDVADEQSLVTAVGEVRERHGRIAGVVHAAGVPGGGLLALRDPEDIAAVLEPKVRGTLLLHRLTEEDRPVMVLCSSVLAVTGAPGQADYVAANAFLDSFAHTTAGAVSIGWDRWTETGMAVRGNTVEWAPGEGEQLESPLFGARRQTPDGWTEFLLRHGPDTAWLSAEHRLAGEPVLPGTALLDLAVAAHQLLSRPVAEASGDAVEPVELDAVFTAPLRIPETQPPVVAVRLRPHADGGHEWEVRSSASTGRPHGHGRIRPRTGPRPAPLDLAALRAGAATHTAAPARGSEGVLVTGPRWDCVTDAYEGGAGVLLTLRLAPQHHEDTAVHPLHPALLDVATGAVAQGFGRHLPVAYRKLTVHHNVAAAGYAQVVLRSGDPASQDTLVADVTLTDGDGVPAVVVEGFVLRPAPAGAANDGTAAGVVTTTGGRGTPGEAEASDGIPTQAGLRALDLILAHPHLPHVLVTHRDTDGLGRSGPGADPEPLRGEGPGGPREGLPKDPAERIAAIWARMLGVPAVALDDNLLELGADSLTIVQIAAEMQNAGLPVSPGDLFAHPTAGALADRLDRPDPAAPDDRTGAAPEVAPSTDPPGLFPDADLNAEDMAQVLNLFRSGEETQ